MARKWAEMTGEDACNARCIGKLWNEVIAADGESNNYLSQWRTDLDVKQTASQGAWMYHRVLAA